MNMTTSATNNSGNKHKKSSSVFKAILPRNHKRSPSDGLALSPPKGENATPLPQVSSKALPSLPSNLPQADRSLAEVNQNRERTRSSPKKSIEVYDDGNNKRQGLRIRTKSFASIRGQGDNEKLKDANKPKGKENTPLLSRPDDEPKLKKTKSSTGLSALLSRPKVSKRSKTEDVPQPKDKENCTPPSSAYEAPPPIWAQFATQPTETFKITTNVPLNDQRDIDEELELYTPCEYSPSKGRNFHDDLPTLSRVPAPKARPKSAYFSSSPSSSSFTEAISGLRKASPTFFNRKQSKKEGISNTDIFKEPTRKMSSDSSYTGQPIEKRGSRVMAAVTAWNGKSKDENEKPKESPVDIEAIESAFENLLDARNIEHNLRGKMRALDINIKADFIKQNNAGSASSVEGLAQKSAPPSRSGTGRRKKTEGETHVKQDTKTENIEPTTPKKSRPRSLTFTLSKGDQSAKKPKSEKHISHERKKSDLGHSASSKSLTSADTKQALVFFNKSTQLSSPDDFITYLHKVQKPQLVEIGKLQKLRQLLRNETVSWVDTFIVKGGMTEILGLLNRIIDIEWREEHEDNLLHHTLTCLKALLTTSLALTHLSAVQSTLFPTLLRLLFSSGEEKKGPSEFSTRSIIISLLFIYLSAASPSTLDSRARTLLSYLRDPSLPPTALPPTFIAEMHLPRPYKLWCKEITNVTKEVFWIFLHHLNVIPYPPLPTGSHDETYATTHFPAPRPPVPAAPYVGGVEWEATTYLATHLDLLNGLLASLPTREERNALRHELRDSGFEKVMGGVLRTCKEKFYGGVHAGLGTWIGAGREDGWDVRGVREGGREEGRRPRGKSVSPKKGKVEEAPRLEMLGLDVGRGGVGDGEGAGGWL